VTVSSTRRLSARPRAVRFDARGRVSPREAVVNVAFTPWLRR
jgi:hypothetical protein